MSKFKRGKNFCFFFFFAFSFQPGVGGNCTVLKHKKGDIPSEAQLRRFKNQLAGKNACEKRDDINCNAKSLHNDVSKIFGKNR